MRAFLAVGGPLVRLKFEIASILDPAGVWKGVSRPPQVCASGSQLLFKGDFVTPAEAGLDLASGSTR